MHVVSLEARNEGDGVRADDEDAGMLSQSWEILGEGREIEGTYVLGVVQTMIGWVYSDGRLTLTVGAKLLEKGPLTLFRWPISTS
jgi:hypothetical protein